MGRRLLFLALVLLAGCAGGKKSAGTYELYDPVRHAKFEAGPIIQVAMDSCEPVRVELIEETGRPLGVLLDSVLCAGVHSFAVRSSRLVAAGETTYVPLDTLSLGAYFYKVFTPTSTRIETIFRR